MGPPRLHRGDGRAPGDCALRWLHEWRARFDWHRFPTGNTIGVYNVATVPPARRRGYGEQITRRITDDAVLAGCDVATLQASDMGKPIYERLGYRTVVEYMGYVES
jgi:GNAT superfamily N-acetyltransferase